MPFNAPASVPQITCASYAPLRHPLYYPPGHSTFPVPPPPQRDIYMNRKLNQHFVSVKAALLAMLRTRHVPSLPSGFPFRCVHGVSGNAHPHLSYSSYEFLEHVVVDPMSPPCCVLFSYTAPAHRWDSAASHGASSSKMTWQIKIPSLNSMSPNEPQTFFTVSQVELDPSVMETHFGYQFMTDNHMLLEALSISLEQGLHLTVQFALSTPCGSPVTTDEPRDVYRPRNRDSLGNRSDDLVFVAKKHDGQREVVYVYDPFEVVAMKS